MISHDLQSIFVMADYVAMLFEGAIIAYDTADAIRNSHNPIVQQFLAGLRGGTDSDMMPREALCLRGINNSLV